jgi:hypothetical protein
MSPRATVEYMNARRALKPASGGKVYPRRAKYAPEEDAPPPDYRLENFRSAYLIMAKAANYRPQAPTDGCGHVQLSAAQLRDRDLLCSEATEYALQFLVEEDEGCFFIGCTDFTPAADRALCWIVEAARQLTTRAAGRATALDLLCLASAELQSGAVS